ncbi:anhydro-N-acetylmuramic acid kinase [Flavobacteriaceae bacterium S356]|uniref:Anhydro-N-acetylmuramic acid kinase n=1 Tax=Asprobacillus argus TaxID=3076534 RepID=A0ABU3LK63_9FLAO|nr:anhydro-N-acetylmuramic acid kinase [Flavobacteriaceae bacterium S356]
MHDDSTSIIGLMSGTSLDGLDAVYVKFNKRDSKDYKIIACHTFEYTDQIYQKLKNGIHKTKEDLKNLDRDFAQYIGNTVNEFIKSYEISDVDFIASHGHTIFHEPAKGLTLQIGSGQEISNVTNTRVVCDFRTQDVLLGGQGAPLVPIGDKFLFSNYGACLNLGGFANVSFDQNKERIAFDICPVNIVLNHYSKKIGLAYDESGRVASSGQVYNELLQVLNDLNFYKLEPPRSLGYEWVLENIFPLIDSYKISVQDILSTYVEHIAIQLSVVLKSKSSILVTGGGAFNTFLMKRVTHYTGQQFEKPLAEIINYKEALIFAFLGLLRMEGKVNCLKSVTGAKKNHSSGVIFNPNNT